MDGYMVWWIYVALHKSIIDDQHQLLRKSGGDTSQCQGDFRLTFLEVGKKAMIVQDFANDGDHWLDMLDYIQAVRKHLREKSIINVGHVCDCFLQCVAKKKECETQWCRYRSQQLKDRHGQLSEYAPWQKLKNRSARGSPCLVLRLIVEGREPLLIRSHLLSRISIETLRRWGGTSASSRAVVALMVAQSSWKHSGGRSSLCVK